MSDGDLGRTVDCGKSHVKVDPGSLGELSSSWMYNGVQFTPSLETFSKKEKKIISAFKLNEQYLARHPPGTANSEEQTSGSHARDAECTRWELSKRPGQPKTMTSGRR